jgi:hypothetical protein
MYDWEGDTLANESDWLCASCVQVLCIEGYGPGPLANHMSDGLTGNDHRSGNRFLHPVRRLKQVLL